MRFNAQQKLLPAKVALGSAEFTSSTKAKLLSGIHQRAEIREETPEERSTDEIGLQSENSALAKSHHVLVVKTPNTVMQT